VWENSTAKGSEAILELPYFGGYLVLLALAIALLMIYQLIEHVKTDKPPKYMRVLSFIVSVIVVIISVLLIVVMSVRAHDYNQNEYKDFSNEVIT
jgi:H+/gluconate symporter-like permease